MDPRKTARSEVREQVHSHPDGLAVFDRQLRFIEINATLAKIHGLAAVEHIGRSIGEILPTLAAAIEPLLQHVLATGEPILDVDIRGELGGKSGRWLVSYHPVHTRSGAVLAVECTVRTLDEQALPTALATTQAALREASEQVAFQAAILANLNDAVVAIDLDERITYWGAGAERFYGFQAAEVLGRPLAEINHSVWLDPADQQAAQQALLNSGRWRGETIHYHRDGTALHVESAISTFHDAAGQPAGQLFVIRDVTAYKTAEQERSELLQREQAAHAAAQQQNERSAALIAALSQLNAQELDLQAVFDTITRCAAAVLGDACALRLLAPEDDMLRTVALYHPDPVARQLLYELHLQPTPFGAGFTGQVARSGVAQLVPKVDQQELSARVQTEYRPYLERFGFHSALCVPVHNQQSDTLVGVLVLTRDTPGRAYTAEDQVFVENLAAHAALAITHAQLFAQLEAERALGDALFTTAPVGLAFVDPELRIQRINQRLAAFDGHDPAEYIGRRPGEVLPVLTEFVEPLLRQVLASGEAILDSEHTEPPDAAGNSRIWRESYYPVYTADGKLLGAGTVVVDITEQRRTADERLQLLTEARNAQEAAEAAVRTRDDLFALISHDFRNPLTTILGQAGVMLSRLSKQPIENDRLKYGLALIEGSAAQLNAQIEELLDLTRIDGGRPLNLNRAPTDLAALVRSAVIAAQSTTRMHQLKIDIVDGTELTCDCDNLRIARVMANLLTNAVKYSPDGGVITIVLQRETDANGDMAVVAVTDQGVGIPAADLPYIFERFHRAGNVSGRIRGTGLGLTSARQIAEQHGGRISVTSTQGSGSTFVLYLPAIPVQHEAGAGSERAVNGS